MPTKPPSSAERARTALLADREPSNDDLYALVCERLETQAAARRAEAREAAAAAPAPRAQLIRRRAVAAMTRRAKGLSPEALTVLGSMTIDGHLAKITAGQLPPKLYKEVNAALEAIGGKWNSGKGGHVFVEDPRDALDQIVLTGEFSDRKQDFGFFETPPALAARVVEMARIRPGMEVLEPSAGRGALVREVLAQQPGTRVGAVEIQPENARAVRALGVDVREADFLTLPVTGEVDRVVMNPPFARGADIDHVCRAFAWLRPGGRLVSIMSAGVTFRQDKKTQAFQSLIEQCGETHDLPPNSFRESGTSVNTVVVVLDKAGGGP